MKSIIEVECKCDAQDIIVNKRHQVSIDKQPTTVHKLLGELLVNLSCYGIKERCAVVEKFFEENPKLFPDDIKALVLTCYRKLRDERVEQTRKDANKRWHQALEQANPSPPSPLAGLVSLAQTGTNKDAREIAHEQSLLKAPPSYGQTSIPQYPNKS